MGQPPAGGYGAYGPPPGGYGYGGYGPPGGSDPDPRARGIAIAALICNVIGIFFCWVLAIAGIICAAIAISKADTDGRTARTLNMWSWIAFGVGLLVAVCFFGFYLFVYLKDAQV